MNRRELLKMIATVTGTAFIGRNILAYEVLPDPDLSNSEFTQDDVELLDWIAETIIPETETPGARFSKCGRAMAVIATGCYDQREREAFINGMDLIRQLCLKRHGCQFVELDEVNRHQLLSALDAEALAYNAAVTSDDSRRSESTQSVPHYFSLMKQLTIFTFFTSKTGATETLRHVPNPGRYEEIPLKPTDKAWAT